MNWYLKVLKEHYADFRGRARRKEYWMFTLFHIIIIMILALLTFVLSDVSSSNGEPNTFALALIGIYVLGTIIPTIAIVVRRLHDVNKSGWWYLINFVPYIGGIILLVFACTDSHNGRNKWGDNPKGIGNDSAIDQIGEE